VADHQSHSRNKEINTMKRILFVTLITLIATTISFAQTQPPAPQLYYVQVLKVNPGMSAEWRALYQNEILPALKKGGAKQSTVFATAFGDVREFIIITPLDSWEQLDEPGRLNKALGQEAARALNAKQSRLLAEWHTYVTALQPGLSIMPTSTEPAKLGVMIRNHVTPGRNAEYEKWAKENPLVVSKKTNVKGVLTGKTIVGGDPNTYTVFVLFDSYAEMSKQTAAAAKVRAEMKLSGGEPAGVVAHREALVIPRCQN
jgi:antibiotic biosynthesis monooxygenase (ABM) superfamily enzyme